MTDADRKRQQGENDIAAIRQALDLNETTLLAALRPLSALRVSVVTGMLTGLFPRSRAKCVAVLRSFYS